MKRRDDLIMDVGMHTGEDTARFLADGFKVVAVEANPELVAAAEEKFAEAIGTGQLKIVSAAISTERGTASFGLADTTVWSSLAPEMIARNEQLAQSQYRYIDVPTLPFEDVLAEHGVPFYLKVDIEGYDMLCVRALRGCQEKPSYISVESHVSLNRAPADEVFDELAELWVLGYRKFRYSNQALDQNEVPSNADWPGPPWRSAWTSLARAQALRGGHNLLGYGGRFTTTLSSRSVNFARRKLLNRQMKSWYDLHAAL